MKDVSEAVQLLPQLLQYVILVAEQHPDQLVTILDDLHQGFPISALSRDNRASDANSLTNQLFLTLLYFQFLMVAKKCKYDPS